jgi:hypothetical protein
MLYLFILIFFNIMRKIEKTTSERTIQMRNCYKIKLSIYTHKINKFLYCREQSEYLMKQKRNT